MEDISLKVSDNRITILRKPMKITSGTVGLPINIIFPDEWEGLEKNVVYVGSGVTKVERHFTGSGTVAWECLKESGEYLKIGVCGRDANNEIVTPTFYASIDRIVEGADDNAGESVAPTPSQLDQIFGQIAEVRNGKQDKLTPEGRIRIDEDSVISVDDPEWGDVILPENGIPKEDLSEDILKDLEKAESAIQEEDLEGYATERFVNEALDQATTDLNNEIVEIHDEIESIADLIPVEASEDNQLADKDYVNSSIATNTANYISNNGQPFQSFASLNNYSGPLSNNDYAFVEGRDSVGNRTYTRYKYNAGTNSWAAEYVLNNSSFTSSQWAAITSGITSGLVTKINTAIQPNDVARENKAGLIKLSGAFGILASDDGYAYLNKASNSEIDAKQNIYKPIVPANLDIAVKKGIVDNNLPLTEQEKANAKEWLGIPDTPEDVYTKSETDQQIQNRIDPIEELIPNQASDENQLADKQYVNSSIATATATFRGTYDDIEDFPETADANDYIFHRVYDSTTGLILRFDRYKWSETGWAYEWTINNSGFTSAQWSALNSGITSGLAALIESALQPGDLSDIEDRLTHMEEVDYEVDENDFLVLSDGNMVVSSNDTVARQALSHLNPEDQPSAVGKILKVLSVNQNGTFTCEWADEQSLADYVKNTDYASSAVGGVVKTNITNMATDMTNAGVICASNRTLGQYYNLSSNAVIGKGTLENIKSDLTKRALTDSTQQAWTSSEQLAACARMGAQKEATTQTVTISASAWNNNSATVPVTGVTADNIVKLSPATKSDADAIGSYGIFCTSQSSGQLSFSCDTTPTSAVALNCMIL